MKVRAQVSVHYAKPEDERSKQVVWVDVIGSDLSILIGPKAETLNALQYIAGLIASKEIGHIVSLVVDVEGFRARRDSAIPPACPADGRPGSENRATPGLGTYASQ